MRKRARNLNGEYRALCRAGTGLQCIWIDGLRTFLRIGCRNEIFHFDASASELTVKVYDRKTIGRDKEVGEALLEVSDESGKRSRRDLRCATLRKPRTQDQAGIC